MKKNFSLLLIALIWNAGAQTASSDTSLKALENQYKKTKQYGNPKAVAGAAVLAGEAYLQAKNHKRSMDFLLVAKDLYKTQNDTKNLIKVSCRLAENYYRTDNDKRYNDYIEFARQLIGTDTLGPEYLLLLDTQIRYFRTRKNLVQERSLMDRKANLQTPTPSEKQLEAPMPEKPIDAVKNPKPKTAVKPSFLPQKENDWRNILLASAIATVALLSGGLIYYFRKDRRQKFHQMAKSNAMQSQMLENIAKAILNTGANQTIAHQLQMLSKTADGSKKSNFELEAIGPLLKLQTAPFLEQTVQKNIALVSNVETSAEEKLVDKSTLEMILTLLWTEALSHTQPENTLYFSAMIDKQQLDIRISYPCGSVSKEQLPHLFESLYQASSENYPNPVGFALLHALVKWYDGSIEATLGENVLRINTRLPLSETRKKPKFVPGFVL